MPSQKTLNSYGNRLFESSGQAAVFWNQSWLFGAGIGLNAKNNSTGQRLTLIGTYNSGHYGGGNAKQFINC